MQTRRTRSSHARRTTATTTATTTTTSYAMYNNDSASQIQHDASKQHDQPNQQDMDVSNPMKENDSSNASLRWMVALVDPSLATAICTTTALASSKHEKASHRLDRVAMTQQDEQRLLQVCRLPDPASGIPRLYVVIPPSSRLSSNHSKHNRTDGHESSLWVLCEIESIPADPCIATMDGSEPSSGPTSSYAAFFITPPQPQQHEQCQQKQKKSFLVSNGTIYTITPVDPLFWFLTDDLLERTTIGRKQAWQPLDQLLLSITWNHTRTDQSNGKDLYKDPDEKSHADPHDDSLVATSADRVAAIVCACVDRTQLQHHLLQSYRLDDDDDSDESILYKRSPEKACQWLSAKRQALEQYLIVQQQQQHQFNEEDQYRAQQQLPTFVLPRDDNETEQSLVVKEMSYRCSGQQGKVVIDDESSVEQAHILSWQMVCHYLTPVWRRALLEYEAQQRQRQPRGTQRANDYENELRRVILGQNDDDGVQKNNESQNGGSMVNGDDSAVAKRARIDSEQLGSVKGNEAAPSWVVHGTSISTQNNQSSSNSKGSSEQKQQHPVVTPAAKKLAQVNTKGMKKMSAFFTTKSI